MRHATGSLNTDCLDTIYSWYDWLSSPKPYKDIFSCDMGNSNEEENRMGQRVMVWLEWRGENKQDYKSYRTMDNVSS